MKPRCFDGHRAVNVRAISSPESDKVGAFGHAVSLDTVAAVVPGARAVLRRLVEVGGTASYDDVQDHFAVHHETPIDPKRIGGTLTSIRAVRRRVGPDNRSNLLERDDRRRIYWIEPSLMEGLKRAFDLAEGRPDLLRQELADS